MDCTLASLGSIIIPSGHQEICLAPSEWFMLSPSRSPSLSLSLSLSLPHPTPPPPLGATRPARTAGARQHGRCAPAVLARGAHGHAPVACAGTDTCHALGRAAGRGSRGAASLRSLHTVAGSDFLYSLAMSDARIFSWSCRCTRSLGGTVREAHEPPRLPTEGPRGSLSDPMKFRNRQDGAAADSLSTVRMCGQ